MENHLFNRHFSPKISFGNLFSLTAGEYSLEMNNCVINAVLNYQRNFFVTGELKNIKAMRLADIALLIGKDISLISRILKDKYFTVNGKIIPVVKFLNSGSVRNRRGQQMSKFQIIELINKIIADEDTNKPYGDKIIANLLEKLGIEISRELVTKFRSKYLELPSSTKRRLRH